MKINNTYPKIVTDETLRETTNHGSEEYPFQYYLEDIWMFDFHCIDWHWHPELEFVYVRKGTVTFKIGSDQFELEEGMGIFVNAQVIHRFESTETAVIPNIVFLPTLMAPRGSLIYKKYIEPVLVSLVSYLCFKPEIAWQREILMSLQQIFAIQEMEKECELETVQELLHIWKKIYEHTELQEVNNRAIVSARSLGQLQIMMQYIHENYPKMITLDDLTGVVMMSKSSVLNIFQKYLHTSPINYLVNYRLKQAARLLVTTENSISVIAQNTGFENTGYFCRKFKELFHKTPGEYRKMSK